MQFIREKGLKETYTWDELQALVKAIDYEAYTIDNEQIAERHVKRKR